MIAARNSGSAGRSASSAARLIVAANRMPLRRCDGQPEVVAEHRLVPSVLLGVRLRSAEHLGPPGCDVGSVVLRDPAWEEAGRAVIGLDAVVEAVDHPAQRDESAGPYTRRAMASTPHPCRSSGTPVVPRSAEHTTIATCRTTDRDRTPGGGARRGRGLPLGGAGPALGLGRRCGGSSRGGAGGRGPDPAPRPVRRP